MLGYNNLTLHGGLFDDNPLYHVGSLSSRHFRLGHYVGSQTVQFTVGGDAFEFGSLEHLGFALSSLDEVNKRIPRIGGQINSSRLYFLLCASGPVLVTLIFLRRSSTFQNIVRAVPRSRAIRAARRTSSVLLGVRRLYESPFGTINPVEVTFNCQTKQNGNSNGTFVHVRK